MPYKQRVLEIVTAMPEGISYQEIVQKLNIWCSDQQADADIRDGRFHTTDIAKQRVCDMAMVQNNYKG